MPSRPLFFPAEPAFPFPLLCQSSRTGLPDPFQRLRNSLPCQPGRHKLLDFRTVSPKPAFHVQHARSCFLLVPRRSLPPRHSPGSQFKLQQPQQTQRHHLNPTRAQHRLLGPRPTLLPTQTLLQIPEPIFLAESPPNTSSICKPVHSSTEPT